MSSRLYLVQFSLKLIIRNISFEPKEDLSHDFSYDIKVLANYKPNYMF